MIKLRLNKNKIVPDKNTIINVGFIILSALLTRFLLDSFGLFNFLENLPIAYKLAVIIGIAVYLKSIIDIQALGRDWY